MIPPKDLTQHDPINLTGVWERAPFPRVCVMRNEAGDVALSVGLQQYGYSYRTHGDGPRVDGSVSGPGSDTLSAALIGGAGGKVEDAQTEAINAARAAGYRIPDPEVPHAR